MSDKKKRSMAGLPWIAAMAFFMQALDATILNTALPMVTVVLANCKALFVFMVTRWNIFPSRLC